MLNIRTIGSYTIQELIQKAKELDLNNSKTNNLKRHELFLQVSRKIMEDEKVTGSGVLEVLDDGFGFLRSANSSYSIRYDDIYISPQQIKKFGMSVGDYIEGTIGSPRGDERHFGLQKIIKINSSDPYDSKMRNNFDHMTPIFPDEMINLNLDGEKSDTNNITNRLISIVSPIGKGQRCLIVAPPRAGKTIVLQNIARAVEKNHPNAKLIVLLIDERPEEVTYMKDIIKSGEVISSTFDEPASKHTQVAEITIERAKRLVEDGTDVVILLDSITRLARAYNTVVPSSGKLLTGGVDASALQKPKKFFGAARNIRNHKSLTIIATALIETGSRMDEVIFEEFKGTGNSEIVLSRSIAEKRIFPAIDVLKSGTRKDDLLLDSNTLQRTWILRKILSSMEHAEATEFLINKIKITANNSEFFNLMRGSNNN